MDADQTAEYMLEQGEKESFKNIKKDKE